MKEPTGDEIRNSIGIREGWWKDKEGTVWVQRWLITVEGYRCLGNERTAFKDIPFVEIINPVENSQNDIDKNSKV